MPLRVLIVDDEPDVREMLVVLCSLYRDIEVVGEASDGHEAIAQADALRPDAVVLDLMMPNLSGVDALPVLARDHPGVRVVVLTAAAEIDPAVSRLSAAVIGKTRVASDLCTALLGR